MEPMTEHEFRSLLHNFGMAVWLEDNALVKSLGDEIILEYMTLARGGDRKSTDMCGETEKGGK